MQEIALRAPEALLGDVLGKEMVQPLAVTMRAQVEVAPNRSLRVSTLMLALDVVIVPDERLELLSAWARRHRHRHRFAPA